MIVILFGPRIRIICPSCRLNMAFGPHCFCTLIYTLTYLRHQYPTCPARSGGSNPNCGFSGASIAWPRIPPHLLPYSVLYYLVRTSDVLARFFLHIPSCAFFRTILTLKFVKIPPPKFTSNATGFRRFSQSFNFVRILCPWRRLRVGGNITSDKNNISSPLHSPTKNRHEKKSSKKRPQKVASIVKKKSMFSDICLIYVNHCSKTGKHAGIACLKPDACIYSIAIDTMDVWCDFLNDEIQTIILFSNNFYL